MPRLNNPRELVSLRDQLQEKDQRIKNTITMCGGTGCRASGCMAVVEAMKKELAEQGFGDDIRLRITGCHGFCEQGPLMVIEPGNLFYCHVQPKDVPEIVKRTVAGGETIERLQYVDPGLGERVAAEREISFYCAQDRALLGQNEQVDPTSIDDYIALKGYNALAKVLTSMTDQQVIDEIKASELRGRGGGGFPTGRKWETCRKEPGPHYVICNADEGDPGAYMDRSILEGNPHLVLEGMMIGAYAVGAAEGYIYVRNEYPLACEHAQIAIEQARSYGLLGENILGTGFCFDVKVARGAGAFVCGESTALMASLEGRVGEPRAKDVHTTKQGLWNRPTNLNNVETWANVPGIIDRGAAWFAAKGTATSKGTKIFALTGKVKNTGLIEVAMGTSLRTIIFDIGGGPIDGGTIKAVQTGGPSGGCLPLSKFHLPVDFETLDKAGSMVGSGGMVVLDDHTCMVELARYFLEFLLDESCGKCVPCRIGLSRMLEIVNMVCQGRAETWHLGLLEDLAETVAETSLCALGKTAPNPVLSTLRYFRQEYEEHILDRRCRAGACRALIHYEINAEKCKVCGACAKACPHGAITTCDDAAPTIAVDACHRCGICRETCKFEAITCR